MKHSRVIWITRSSVLIAMIVAVQAATIALAAIPMLRQYVTGSIVNMILIVSVMAVGLPTGLCVGVFSPIFASLLGVVPGWQWPLAPFMILGNVSLVVVWHLIGKRSIVNKYVTRCITVGAAAAVKFFVLYFGIVQLLLHVLELQQPQINALSTTFSITQVFTAIIGGVLATVVLPIISKAIKPDPV